MAGGRDEHLEVVQQAQLYTLDFRELVESCRERKRYLVNLIHEAVGEDPSVDAARTALEAAVLIGPALVTVAELTDVVDHALRRYLTAL
jgi:hypothetical protein